MPERRDAAGPADARRSAWRREWGGRLVLLAGAVGLAVVTFAAWAVWQRMRDPMQVLDRDPGAVRGVADSAYRAVTDAGETRMLRDLTLATARAGTVRVTTSRPTGAAEDLPLVVILAGLRTGREALAEVPAHGRALLVAYEYPYSRETWYRKTKLTQIPAIRRAVFRVPAQVSAAVRWLRRTERAGTRRSALLGYSFGALFVPAVQRVAAADGRPFEAVILAYGGADLALLFRANLDFGPAPARRAVAWTAATVLWPVEPSLHLPHLPGRFLVITGARDEQVPAASSEELVRLVPEPRRVVRLEAGHMGPGNPELTARVVRLSQEWLAEEGIVAFPSGFGDLSP